MAEDKVDIESLLSRAKEQEKGYDWLGAASSYSNAIEAIPKDDFLRVGQTQEARANACFKGAMQAENIEEFKDRLSKSERQYEKAKQTYAEAHSPRSASRTSRCEAMIAYLGFWQTSDAVTKRKKVGDAWSFAKMAMDAFGRNEVAELAKTYNELFLSAFFSVFLSNDQEFRETTLREAVEYGERVVGILSDTENRDQLAVALVYVAESLVALNACAAVSGNEYDSNHEKATESWQRAVGLSEETALVAKASADLDVGLGDILWKDFEQIAKRQLECVKHTHDRYALGITHGILGFLCYWDSEAKDDPEHANARLDEALRYVEEARREFGKIRFVDPGYQGFWISSSGHSWYYRDKSLVETDLQKKRELTRKALEAARLELEAAEKSGYPGVVAVSRRDLMMALADSAKITASKMDKAKLLEEAVNIGKELSRLGIVLWPGDYWGIGMVRCKLATTELEFADATDIVELKRESLNSSILHMREGLNLIADRISLWSYADLLDEAAFVELSIKWRSYGRILRSSFAMTGDRETLINSATAFEKAAEFDGKAGQPSRVAESLWETAQVYDSLGNHLKASERFEEASQQYGNAARKIKSLSLLYNDHSLYMKAWSEIEQARHHHARQEPSSAKECYRNAAEHHQSTVKWNSLSTNYFACAQLENAEDLSQREQSKESIEAFKKTANLSKDSKRTMQEMVAKIDGSAEKRMVEWLIDAADHRGEFCEARIVLEEARLLDKEGNLSSASEKYGLAADMFAKIKQGLISEQERKEIELIMSLSKAWKAMAKAEAASSPELYEEAAHLFDEAKNLSPGDKAKNLALGHSRLCMALGAGARYADSGDNALHAAAAQNLESAAKFYLKADLQSAADYAKASKLLFDSYAYVNRAGSEEDQEKKTKLYTMAEKVLQASVSSFEKAGQPGRKEQVLKILAKVKEDRELAMSLAEVFLAPDIVSTTKAFSSPTPTQEAAMGLDRFEHADVQATMIAKPKELHVGEELVLEIELVNAGRGPAQLTKVESMVPEGFVVVQEPEKFRMEDSQINLRGRRLDALKTEDVRLIVKPTAKGSFRLKPRIMYLDDSGANRTCEPVPVEVTVREMGISGWLRGT
jgi:hypothetical protein